MQKFPLLSRLFFNFTLNLFAVVVGDSEPGDLAKTAANITCSHTTEFGAPRLRTLRYTDPLTLN